MLNWIVSSGKKKKKASVTTNADKHTDNFTVLTPQSALVFTTYYSTTQGVSTFCAAAPHCFIVPKIQ